MFGRKMSCLGNGNISKPESRILSFDNEIKCSNRSNPPDKDPLSMTNIFENVVPKMAGGAVEKADGKYVASSVFSNVLSSVFSGC